MARPRTATALKLIKGTAQKCRINKAEPKPRRAVPSPPAHLSDKAKTTWGAVSVMLDRTGVITEQDGLALESLCEAYADLVAARAVLVAHGSTSYESVNKDGNSMWRAYPEVALVADADRRLGFWLTKVGMTPADRSRVSGSETEREADPWDSL